MAAASRSVPAVEAENAVLRLQLADLRLELEMQNQRLEQSEERFSTAFAQTPIGVALVSLEGAWLKANMAVCELTGYSEAELLTRSFQDITHPEDLELDMENVHRMLAGEIRSYQLEKRYFHKDGHIVTVLLDVALVRDKQDQPVYFISQLQDITERKRAMKRQREEEERYLRQRDALIDFTGAVRSGEDLTATIHRLTETAARTLNVSRVSVWRYNDDRSAIHCLDLFEQEHDRHTSGFVLTADAYPGYFCALENMDVIPAHDAHDDPRTREFSESYLKPLGITSMLDAPLHLGGAGEGVLCHEHIGPQRRWAADEETFAVAVANRVSLALESSERERVARDLSGALAQLEQMLDHNPAIVYGLKIFADRNLPITVSGNVTALLGYPLEEALTDHWWWDNLHPDDRERASAGNRILMEQGVGRFEYRFRHKLGDYRWIEDNQRLLRNPSGEPAEIVGVWLDISDRKDAEARFEKLHKEMIDMSRQAGMAEVASSVLHNVGNVLNSVNVSCSVLTRKMQLSRISSVAKVADLLSEHSGNLGGFFSGDAKGRKLPAYLRTLAKQLADEQSEVLDEVDLLARNIEHIKNIVSMQQSYGKVSGIAESVSIADLMDDSVQMNGDSLLRHDVQVIRDCDDVPAMMMEKHKVLQILVNLIRNAKQACTDSGRAHKQITLRATSAGDGVRIAVIDNGVGIAPEDMTRIFSYGFTTKKDGHGFGLHSSVLAAQEIGGRLTAHSDGPGTGATFTLELH